VALIYLKLTIGIKLFFDSSRSKIPNQNGNEVIV